MDLLKDTIMFIGIPPGYHNTLCRWAAEQNSKNPAHQVKPETIACATSLIMIHFLTKIG